MTKLGITSLGTEIPSDQTGFLSRLGDIIKKIGISKASVLTGKSTKSIYRYLQGAEIPHSAVRDLARAGEVTLDWLSTGEEAKVNLESNRDDVDSDTILIPRVNARLSAGHGQLNDYEEVIDYIPFTREFLQKKLNRTSAKGLVITEADGDSMEPTIKDGSLLLIDQNEKNMSDCIMAFVYEDGASVKRLQKLGHSVNVISDNKDLYPSFVIEGDNLNHLNIIGRIRWIGNLS